VQIEALALENAAGAIASTAPIQVTFVLKVVFDTGKKGSHDVSVARTAADFDLADRIAVQPASGWKIPKGSVGPEALQARYDDGSLHGSQAEMQGAEPLTFRLTSDAGLPWWGWTLLALVVLGAAAGLLFYLRKRRGKA